MMWLICTQLLYTIKPEWSWQLDISENNKSRCQNGTVPLINNPAFGIDIIYRFFSTGIVPPITIVGCALHGTLIYRHGNKVIPRNFFLPHCIFFLPQQQSQYWRSLLQMSPPSQHSKRQASLTRRKTYSEHSEFKCNAISQLPSSFDKH